MTRRVLALPLAALVLGSLAAPALASADPVSCTNAYRAALADNPWEPLPHGGGGGEPGGAPMPGQPTRWAQWNQAATVAYAKCLAS
jgi:hypothetical protein